MTIELPEIGSTGWGQSLNTAMTQMAAAVDGIAEDVDLAVSEAVDGHTPGSVLAYAERTSTFTSVDTVGTSVSSMLVNVTGAGRPAQVEWWVPGPFHTVANTRITVGIQWWRNSVYQGYLQIGSARSPLTTNGDSVTIARQLVLDDGVSYAFCPAVAGGAVGTTNLGISGANISYLSVISR